MTTRWPWTDATPDGVAVGILTSLADCYRATLDAVAGADVLAGSRHGLVYGLTPLAIPAFNRVMATDMASPPTDEVVDDVLAILTGALALSWWLPSGGARAAIETRLADRGFHAEDGPDTPAMWVETDRLGRGALPAGLAIEAVLSPAGLDEVARLTVAGFGLPAVLEPAMGGLFRRIGTRPASPIQAFVARLDGRPVATALGVVSGAAVGIYNVATIPEARGRGIGRAVTLAALIDGRERGARVGVLESSPMGLPVYRRIGLRVAGGFRILERFGGSPYGTPTRSMPGA